MRDKNRIKPFLEKFEELWSAHPDLRFGQLVYVLASELGLDIFNMEEKEWLCAVETMIDKYNN